MTGASRLEALLAEAARRLGDRAILWRGASFDGSDVDLLVLDSTRAELVELLEDQALHLEPGGIDHATWTGAELPFDVLSASAWPSHYPSLEGLRARAERRASGPPIASAEDRLLIFAADALAGRPIERLAARMERLLDRPGARERLRQVAANEGLGALAELAANPGRLAAKARDATRSSRGSPESPRSTRARPRAEVDAGIAGLVDGLLDARD